MFSSKWAKSCSVCSLTKETLPRQSLYYPNVSIQCTDYKIAVVVVRKGRSAFMSVKGDSVTCGLLINND